MKTGKRSLRGHQSTGKLPSVDSSMLTDISVQLIGPIVKGWQPCTA